MAEQRGMTTHQYCKNCDMWRRKPFETVIDRHGRRLRRCKRCAEEIREDKAFYERNPEFGI